MKQVRRVRWLSPRDRALHARQSRLGAGPLRVNADGRQSENTVEWELASEVLRTWAIENGIDPEGLQLAPEDLGLRITYLTGGTGAEPDGPDCDFAVPFA